MYQYLHKSEWFRGHKNTWVFVMENVVQILSAFFIWIALIIIIIINLSITDIFRWDQVEPSALILSIYTFTEIKFCLPVQLDI
jgi:hypothetical protein